MEYYWHILPDEVHRQIKAAVSAQLGTEGEEEEFSTDGYPGGSARIWQEGYLCVTLYEVGAVHATGVEPESPLGQLLARIVETHPESRD